MPKSSRGGRRSTPATNSVDVNSVDTNDTTPSLATILANPVGNAVQMTDADAQKLRDDQDSVYDGSVTAAVKMYISGQPGTPAANIDGQGHSMSQAMNYLLENGVDLNTATVDQVNKQFGLRLSPKAYASMQYANAYMEAGSHALGKDTLLTRGAHDAILRNEFGISDYTKLSDSQLKAKLVGGTITTKAYTSTSYDASKSPFLNSASGVAGGREVIYKIKAGANTKVLMGAKSQAEIILNKGTNFRITDVYYSGQMAYPRNKGAMKQIIIEMETF